MLNKFLSTKKGDNDPSKQEAPTQDCFVIKVTHGFVEMQFPLIRISINAFIQWILVILLLITGGSNVPLLLDILEKLPSNKTELPQSSKNDEVTK
ncbi:MAG: hypothetical protein AB4063_12375 [Crocosphaera sp.]